MAAVISYVLTVAEAQTQLGDPEARALGSITPAMSRTVDELAICLPDSTTVHVARDAKGRCLAHLRDAAHRYPIGETFAVSERGAIGHTGTASPTYYDTLTELLGARREQ